MSKGFSDSDLNEFSVSGQWRCTVEEVQDTAMRLLQEKRELRRLLEETVNAKLTSDDRVTLYDGCRICRRSRVVCEVDTAIRVREGEEALACMGGKARYVLANTS
jgi:hypothetical protein